MMSELMIKIVHGSGVQSLENRLTENLFARAVGEILYDMLSKPQEDSFMYEKSQRFNYKLLDKPKYMTMFMDTMIDSTPETTTVSNLAISLLDILGLICVSSGINRDPRSLYKDIRKSLTCNIVF